MGADTQIDMQSSIIFFDGVCNLCNASINFIIDRDPEKRFLFASLQSNIARQKLEAFGMDTNRMESIILLKDGKIYKESSAALRIALGMNGAWPILYVFWLIPKPIRDFVYRLIAKNRYKWFGKRETCRLPTPDLKERFLDSY